MKIKNLFVIGCLSILAASCSDSSSKSGSGSESVSGCSDAIINAANDLDSSVSIQKKSPSSYSTQSVVNSCKKFEDLIGNSSCLAYSKAKGANITLSKAASNSVCSEARSKLAEIQREEKARTEKNSENCTDDEIKSYNNVKETANSAQRNMTDESINSVINACDKFERTLTRSCYATNRATNSTLLIDPKDTIETCKKLRDLPKKKEENKKLEGDSNLPLLGFKSITATVLHGPTMIALAEKAEPIVNGRNIPWDQMLKNISSVEKYCTGVAILSPRTNEVFTVTEAKLNKSESGRSTYLQVSMKSLTSVAQINLTASNFNRPASLSDIEECMPAAIKFSAEK